MNRNQETIHYVEFGSEYGFSLTRIFPYKDRMIDFVLIWEYTGQRNPLFWHNLRSDFFSI